MTVLYFDEQLKDVTKLCRLEHLGASLTRALARTENSGHHALVVRQFTICQESRLIISTCPRFLGYLLPLSSLHGVVKVVRSEFSFSYGRSGTQSCACFLVPTKLYHVIEPLLSLCPDFVLHTLILCQNIYKALQGLESSSVLRRVSGIKSEDRADQGSRYSFFGPLYLKLT